MIFNCVFALFSLIAFVNCHNWVNSPSRSPQANTVGPFLPSSTGRPHVKVRAGQPFQVEWVQGHGGSVWFVLLAEGDQDKAKLHTAKMMDDYLAEAGADKKVPSGKWSRWHRSAKNDKVHGKMAGYFVGNVPKTNGNYITRDATFEGTFAGQPKGGIKPADVFQMTYPAACLKDDRLTYHKSSKYPWVIGMRRAKICVHEPSRPDVALLQFPTGTKPGNYIVHYRWNGYYDAIDVEIVGGSKNVAKPYGIPLPPGQAEPPAVYQKIDHCEFKNPAFRFPCMRMVNTEKACLLTCARNNYIACDGVNVVSLFNRNSVPAAFRNITNIKFDDNSCQKSDVFRGVDKTKPDYNIKVCYGVKAAPRTDISVDFHVTNDPEDPAFYSTCWKRVPPAALLTPAPPAKPKPQEYVFGYDKCLSCPWAKRSVVYNKTALWPLRNGNRCVNCDKPPIKYTASQNGIWLNNLGAGGRGQYNKTHKVVTGWRHDGFNGNWRKAEACPKLANGNSQSCNARIRVLGGSIDVDVIEADVAKLRATKYPTFSKVYQLSRIEAQALEGRPETAQYIVHLIRNLPCCLNAPLVPAAKTTVARLP